IRRVIHTGQRHAALRPEDLARIQPAFGHEPYRTGRRHSADALAAPSEPRQARRGPPDLPLRRAPHVRTADGRHRFALGRAAEPALFFGPAKAIAARHGRRVRGGPDTPDAWGLAVAGFQHARQPVLPDSLA